MTILIATPAYRADSIEEQTKATGAAILQAFPGSRWAILPGLAWVDHARSTLVSAFLKSNASHLLFLDADNALGDPAATVGTLLDALRTGPDVGAVTCTYRQRRPGGSFLMRTLRGEHPCDAPMRRVGGARLLDVESDGLGCCLVSRACLEALWARHSPGGSGEDLSYLDEQNAPGVHLFWHGVMAIDGQRRLSGESRAFFQRVRGAGFRVECLADADCSHSGVPGNLARDVLDASIVDAAAQ